MRRWMRAMSAAACLAATAACARQVEVRTGESPATASTTIQFTNGLGQAVNVYVRPNTGAGEVFIRQVPAGATESVAIRGVSPGTSVSLRAAPVDGKESYSRDNVVLAQGYSWRVP